MVSLDDIGNVYDTEKNNGLKLAVVTTISETKTARVTFYGESTESQKGFNYLASYEPCLNDIVLMFPIADTYIILGSVFSFDTIPNHFVTASILQNYVTTAQLNTTLGGYATTGALNGYAVLAHAHSKLYSQDSPFGNYVTLDTSRSFRAHSTGVLALGSSGCRWTTVYADSGTVQTSDLRKKTAAKSLSNKYEKLFSLLKPISYRFKKGKEVHTGFGAQDVEDSIIESGLKINEFAGLVKDPVKDTDGNIIDYEYSLNYSEFAALNVHMTQKLMSRVDFLENRIKALENGGIS